MLEIQDEATEAIRHHDPEWIARLLAEVEQSGWIDAPPEPLVQSLRKVGAQVKGDRARGALEDVAARLDEALDARDPIRGRLARHEWNRLAAEAALSHDDPIAERARPALDWLDDQDHRDRENREHAEAIAGLVRALDYPGTLAPDELERLAHAVQGRGDGFPEGLRQRYITRLRDAEAAQTRRKRRIAAGSAAGVLLAGTLIYLAVHAQARSREAEQAAVSISDRLELGEVDQAIALAKKLEAADPDLFKYPALVEVRQRVELAQSKESDRALQFDQAMREAQAAPVSVKPPPALETARSLARLDTEKAQLDELVRRRAAALEAEAGRREKEIAPRLDAVARRGRSDRGPAQRRRPGPTARRGAAGLGRRFPAGAARNSRPTWRPPAPACRSGSRGLSDRLEAVRTRMEQRGQQGRLEDAITAAVSYSPDGPGFKGSAELASAIQAFSKAFPDSPRSHAFAATLRDQPVWDAIGEWDRLTTGWRDGRAAVAPQEASVRAEQCRQFLVQHPASPEFERTTAYRQAMEAVSHRSAEGEGGLGKLQKLMTDLLVNNLWMVTVRAPASGGPRQYYATEQPARNARTVRYLVGFDGKERTLTLIADWVQKIDVSPQTKIAQKFKPVLLQDPTQIDWEVTLLDLIDQVRTQPGMDPVLRVALLRKVLELGLEGSEPLQAALGGLKNQVDQADVDVNVPWMDPESREAEPVRPKAAAFVRHLPDLTALRKDVLARRSKVQRLMADRPRAVGWLARGTEGWLIRTGAVLPQQGTLQIAIAGQRRPRGLEEDRRDRSGPSAPDEPRRPGDGRRAAGLRRRRGRGRLVRVLPERPE